MSEVGIELLSPEPLTDEEIQAIVEPSPEEIVAAEQLEKDIEGDCLYRMFIEAMQVLGFNEDAINHFKESKYYQNGLNQNHITQRSEFIMYVNRLFVMATELVRVDGELKLRSEVTPEIAKSDEHRIPMAPNQIRVALTLNESINAWTTDVVAGVLPYILENQDVYYFKRA